MRTVRVMNTTTGETLAERANLAETFLSRFLGLQGRRSLAPGAGLVLLPNNSVHMFFMRFAIDVIFVACDGQVLRVARALRPWTVGPLVPGALYCVELPVGAATGTQPGHQVELQPV
jgi:uncharacterized membrane protein (UPF0127 family)